MSINDLKSEGYGFLIELKFRAWKQGFTPGEPPIVFRDRECGASKLGKKIMWEALWLVLRLRKE